MSVSTVFAVTETVNLWSSFWLSSIIRQKYCLSYLKVESIADSEYFFPVTCVSSEGAELASQI
jgi:hypothetical protein